MSSRLTSESRMYADRAKDLNRQVSLLQLQVEWHGSDSNRHNSDENQI